MAKTRKPPRITTGGPASNDRIRSEAKAGGYRGNSLDAARKFLIRLNNPSRPRQSRSSAGAGNGG